MLIDELRNDRGQHFCADTRIIVSNIVASGMRSHRHIDIILSVEVGNGVCVCLHMATPFLYVR